MKTITTLLTGLVLVSSSLSIRAGTETVYSQQQPANITSDEGKYIVSLHSTSFPLPLHKIHSWKVKVTTPEGKPVEGAKIRIHGGMPAHRHGFPTTPRVDKYLGNGEYQIDGIKFSMPGEWEMRINIKQEAQLKRDRAVFKINL